MVRPQNLAIFFLTLYTMIHSVTFAPIYMWATSLGVWSPCISVIISVFNQIPLADFQFGPIFKENNFIVGPNMV